MENRKYKMYCLGCRGSHSVFGRQYLEFGGQTSCYVIKCNDYAMVIDCGTGLYEARDLLSDCNIIDVLSVICCLGLVKAHNLAAPP